MTIQAPIEPKHPALIRKEAERAESVQNQIADSITTFAGSMMFVYIHLLWFAIWIVINKAMSKGFDPFPFGLLTMIVSLEAIFLSTFVLISQNREQRLSAVRDEIQTQIALYEEQELTQVLRIVHRIEKHLGLKEDNEKMVRAMEHFVDSDDLFREIEQMVTRKP